jgi:hypothetical protein
MTDFVRRRGKGITSGMPILMKGVEQRGENISAGANLKTLEKHEIRWATWGGSQD